MRLISSISLLILVIGCSSEEPASELNLTANEAQFWRQVAFRYPATGELVPVAGREALQLKISGEDVLMVTDSSRCSGKIADSTISLDFSCSYISPVWFIVERTKDRIFIYPKLGAMYYYDYVMEKVDSLDCLVPPQCNLAPDAGFCDAYIPKYYFDKASGKCREFIWGGCEGVVPFNTMEECKACECNGNPSDK